VAAERCLLLKSGKNENIDDDDDSLSGESDWDWSGKDFADGEKETRDDDAKGNDERTEVGRIMETSVIGKLGNKPPSNAYIKNNQVKTPSFQAVPKKKEYILTTTPHNSISLSFFPLSFHSPLSGFGAPKPFAHSDLPKPSLSLLALYARLLLANSCKYGSKFSGDGGGLALGSGDNVRPCRKS
jgi:hypothetical protein